jgi:hypothetical protein
MTVMGAARDAAWAKAEPCLNAMAAKVYRLGDRAGNGSKVKIINQLLAGVHIAAAAEAMALGLREGVDAAALYDVITHSAGNSWMFENRMAHVLANDYTPLSAVDIFVKDLGLVLDTARATKFPLPWPAPRTRCSCRPRPPASPRKTMRGDQDLPRHRAAGGEGDDVSAWAASPTTSPAPPTSPTTWFAPACGWCSSTACPRPARRGDRTSTPSSSPSSRAPSRRPSGGAVARGLPVPAGRRRDPDLLQGLLDLRFDAARQHRPGARGADGRARLPLHDRHAGLPDNGRTVFKGHLFVGDVLLSESGMRNHPLTPMTDANLVRVLQAQLATTRGPTRRRGASAWSTIARSAPRARPSSSASRRSSKAAWRSRSPMPSPTTICSASALRSRTCRWSAPDRAWRSACRRTSDLGFERIGVAAAGQGFRAIVSGSCSRRPTARWRTSSNPAARPPGRCARARRTGRCADREHRRLGARAVGGGARARGPRLQHRAAAGGRGGAGEGRGHDVGARLERILAAVARRLVENGARRLVIAGGETSGACVQALGVSRLRIGAQIDPGVPWCHAAPALAAEGMHLALKSGNFGGVDFFDRAFTVGT